MPLWTWTTTGAWYGVPLKNFWGWWAVGFLFVGCYVLLGRWIRRVELRLLLVFPVAIACFLAGVRLYRRSGIGATGEVAVTVAILAGSLLVLLTDDLLLGETVPEPVPWHLTAVPLIYHVSFLTVGAWLGVFGEHPILFAVALSMLAVTASIHVLPHAIARWQPAAGAPT